MLERVQRLNQELEMLQFCNPELGINMTKFKHARRKADKATFTYVEGKGWVNDVTKQVEVLPADERKITFFNAPTPTIPGLPK